nr:hypothetical protein [Tanacetum cinerariifolium]
MNGPAPVPTVEIPATSAGGEISRREKTLAEYTTAEKDRAHADDQAESMLSQGLPRHIFDTLNQTESTKEIWDNIELLMKGLGLNKQQKKEELYDEYERFRAIGNEPIHDYFVRFHKLINDMKITKLTFEAHQQNTKFLNNLPPHWAKYVTIVKQNHDISQKSYTELYTYLKAFEPHTTRTLKKREDSTNSVDPLAYLAQTSKPASSLPKVTTIEEDRAVNAAMLETMKNMMNLMSGYQKRFPPMNNQLRTSSNSRSHATVNDGQIVTEPTQRKAPGNVSRAGTSGTNSYAQKTEKPVKKIICYNYRGEGHVARQCKEPKRAKDTQYFKDIVMLSEDRDRGVQLDAEAEAFLADSKTMSLLPSLAMVITNWEIPSSQGSTTWKDSRIICF